MKLYEDADNTANTAANNRGDSTAESEDRSDYEKANAQHLILDLTGLEEAVNEADIGTQQED
mgnify:CR=1 FL=1|jgi:hypothetical protein